MKSLVLIALLILTVPRVGAAQLYECETKNMAEVTVNGVVVRPESDPVSVFWIRSYKHFTFDADTGAFRVSHDIAPQIFEVWTKGNPSGWSLVAHHRRSGQTLKILIWE